MPAPPNDDFVNAIALTGLSGTVAGNNHDATTDIPYDALEDSYGAAKTVWYKLQLPGSWPDKLLFKWAWEPTVSNDLTAMVFETSAVPPTSSGDVTEYDVVFASSSNTHTHFVDPYLASGGSFLYIGIASGDSGSPTSSFTFDWEILLSPVNNNFADAILLEGSEGVVDPVEISTADTEIGEPGAAFHTIWYKWVAPLTSTTLVTTLGSVNNEEDSSGDPLDTILAVYTGTSLGDLVEVESNDDGPIDSTSLLVFEATEGETYWFQAGTYSEEAFGTIHLEYQQTTASFNTRLVGQTDSSFAQPTTITGEVTSSSTHVSKVTGQATSTTTRDVRIVSEDSSARAYPTRMTGQATSSSTRVSKVTGQATTFSTSITKVVGQADASIARSTRAFGGLYSQKTAAVRLLAEARTGHSVGVRIVGQSRYAGQFAIGSADLRKITGSTRLKP
jgi:hypothetical protein